MQIALCFFCSAILVLQGGFVSCVKNNPLYNNAVMEVAEEEEIKKSSRMRGFNFLWLCFDLILNFLNAGSVLFVDFHQIVDHFTSMQHGGMISFANHLPDGRK